MARIGIYGGSFNPPHLGHMLAAKEFCRALNLDRLLLVPAKTPPHKELPEGTPDEKTRLELLHLAAEDLPCTQISEMELDRPGVSYTVDTLRRLRTEYPDDTLFLCMGTDMFQSFDRWYQADEICKLATVVMANRMNADEEKLRQQKAAFSEKYGQEPVILKNEFLEMSSTDIRRLLIFDCAENYLPPEVLQRIKAEGLYGTAKDRKKLSFEELKRESLSLHKSSRVDHVLGCSETAEKLAILHGADPEDARRAGILHDVTKALSGEDQLRLCEKYGIILGDFDRKHTKLLHAVTGAAVAERIFGENEAVCQAIRWHTSGKADMTTLEKIIYVADYMEPNRDFPGVEELRALAHTDLDAAMYLGLTMTAEHLRKQGAEMGKHSIEAMAFLDSKRD